MKFILFIVTSLLASLLHAAAMPIHTSSESSTITKSAIAEHHAVGHHANMTALDHSGSDAYCPDSNDSCCLMTVIQEESIRSLLVSLGKEVYALPSSHSPKSRPKTLYKPPKFY